jgi:molybdate transport system substrate-binding protein
LARDGRVNGAIVAVMRSFVPLVLLALALAACSERAAPHAPTGEAPPANQVPLPPPEASLEVFAAASLRDVIADFGEAFVSQGHPAITANFAGSNVLAQQIRASSRGDVFLSADDQWVNDVIASGHAEPTTRAVVASNSLVIVAHPASAFTLASAEALPALRFAHLSLADPTAVPAGRYAKAYLSSLRARRGTVWDAVAARIAPAADVRAALAVVASQQDVVGIVYRTDARAARVRVLFDVPQAALPSPVRYTAVAIRNRHNDAAARAFLALLASSAGRGIFERRGFLPPPGP